MKSDDADFMRLAIEEAKKGEGKTYPNPIVGAVIVEAGAVVSKGFHAVAGEAHAELNAFNALARPPAKDAVLYVTLEPCSTFGKTPPCTELIIASGITRVVIGTLDPNPEHSGRAVSLLEEAGILVVAGVLEAECTNLNEDFNRRMKEQANE